MNKKLIRLTENDLHRIVKISVNKILREADEWDDYDDGEEEYDDDGEEEYDDDEEEEEHDDYYRDEGFWFLYSPEVGALDGTYETYESAEEDLMAYADEYEDLTIYYAPQGDMTQAYEA